MSDLNADASVYITLEHGEPQLLKEYIANLVKEAIDHEVKQRVEIRVSPTLLPQPNAVIYPLPFSHLYDEPEVVPGDTVYETSYSPSLEAHYRSGDLGLVHGDGVYTTSSAKTAYWYSKIKGLVDCVQSAPEEKSK